MKLRTTASDGKNYHKQQDNLLAIIADCHKEISKRAMQFIKWSTQILQEFTNKDFAMEDERLKKMIQF
jgi:hypothetical protein